MSRDLFVGPLCRFFAAGAADASARRAGVESWRAEVVASLAGRWIAPLAWDEDPSIEPAWFDLGPRGLDAVRLLAVYADRPELELPDAVPQPLDLDPNWATAERADFERSRYGQLLAAEIWLPGEFDFTFRCPRPDGEDATFGSLRALREQLGYLNARTFGAGDELLADWQQLTGERFVDVARRGLAVIVAAVVDALDRRVPVVLQR